MKRYIAAIVMAAVMLVAGSALAVDVTDQFVVSVAIPASCSTIVGGSPSLGAYDGTADVTGSFNITSTCRNATNFEAYITGTRELTNGADAITIDFCTAACDGSNNYPADTTGTATEYAAASNNPEDKTVYYKIASGQLLDAMTAGTYTGSLTINVDY